jgi:hypothetical protein
MTLDFPNRSRSFDEVRNAVRFTGYDGMLQVPFLVEATALIKSDSAVAKQEEECLAAFDSSREVIHAAARKVYSQGRSNLGNMNVLSAANLR